MFIIDTVATEIYEPGTRQAKLKIRPFIFFLMKSNARRGAPERCSPYESRKILALLKRRES